jgi:hypothetical protein
VGEVLFTQGGGQMTAGHEVSGEHGGGGGQGGGAHEDPPVHGGVHGSDVTGACSVRACLVACGVPCDLCVFSR